MSYVTQAQLEERYGTRFLVSLTDRGQLATGTIDATTVARAIADTAAEINGHIAPRYALPVATVPPLLRDIASAIAIWKLHTAEPNEKLKNDHKRATEMLKLIAAGTVTLPLATGDVAETTGTTGARVTDRNRPMTEKNMTGFI